LRCSAGDIGSEDRGDDVGSWSTGKLTATETELELCFVLVIEELLDLGAGSGVLDGGKKLVTVGGSW
jgi:hypothetical protein